MMIISYTLNIVPSRYSISVVRYLSVVNRRSFKLCHKAMENHKYTTLNSGCSINTKAKASGNKYAVSLALF